MAGVSGGFGQNVPPARRLVRLSASDPYATLVGEGDVATKLGFLPIEVGAVLTSTPAALHEGELHELKLLLPAHTEGRPASREEDRPVLQAEREVAGDELELLWMEQVADLSEELADDDAPVAHHEE